ncbi:MAG: hypothetical protein Hyperionvirus7_5 [Hyperionvirus sp.]|uniref:Uncharacterized protein n=1 Tax=Hyperionvirus sp. TaxID=2487770 RepID=A0A3G5AAA7_9VIRU|nr:MAG: hypothetical protein Hyperionvirus7_5 [Hyperionvirus sp.]
MSMTFRFNIVNNRAEWYSKTYTRDELFRIIPSLSDRDMHIIDDKMQFRISSFSSKKNAILIKLDDIRAIIFKDVAMFTELPNQLFYDNLTLKIKNNAKLSFELQVLEEIFIHISNRFESEVKVISPGVTNIINVLQSQNLTDISDRDIMSTQIRLISFHFKIKDICDLLEDLSEWDEKDYGELCLSATEPDIAQAVGQTEDILATYRRHFEEEMDMLDKMKKSIATLLSIKDVQMSSNRNKMAMVTIYLTVFALSLNLATLITGLFGMNMSNYIQFYHYSFVVVLISITVMIVIVYSSVTKAIDRSLSE